MLYNIVRYFYSSKRNSRVIQSGVTLQEAIAHCENPQYSSNTAKGKGAYTRKNGPWFDGYSASK